MMGKLFPIPLMGLGTAEVESFGSYIHRCAYEHGVFVGELMRFVYDMAVQAGLKTKYHVELPHYFDTSEVIRENRLSETMVCFFEFATSQKLKSGTLLGLRDVVGRFPGFACKWFAWCPHCLREDLDKEQSPYFRLQWHICSYCPIHYAELLNKCLSCGSAQRFYTRRLSLDRCMKCGQSLTLYEEKARKQSVVDSWMAPNSDVIQLLSDMAKEPTITFCNRGIRESLDHLLKKYNITGSEIDFEKLAGHDLRTILSEDRPLSIMALRRLCFRLGISLTDLLTGNTCQTTEQIIPFWYEELPLELKVRPKPKSKNHVEIMGKVCQIIENSSEPLPVKEIARITEVSVGYLEYRYPNLMKEVAKKYKKYREQIHKEKIQSAQEHAAAFFLDNKYKTYRKSRKEAYRVLSSETGLPKFMLKRAIQSVYAALN